MPAGNDRQAGALAPTGNLKRIKVSEIAPNKRNPRQTFEQDKIEQLAASLEQIGLQVPITVYENPRQSQTPYILLDGERRYRAAKLINWATILALVVPRPSPSENAIRMFNIHMLREDWDELETAWALEEIIRETGIDNDRDLKQLTGLSIDRVRNMRRVLSYPKSVQEKVANEEITYQFLVELDKNVLSRTRDKKKVGKKPVVDLGQTQLRDVFLKKYLDKVETDIVELRKVGTLIDTARSEGIVADRARTALAELVNDPKRTIEEAYDTGAASSVELSRVLRDMDALPDRVDDLLGSGLESEQRREVRKAIKVLQEKLGEVSKKAAK